ncbi:hypothetical protein GDO81_011463 [Engystomops pustulosus]|uniref:Uncharacterized protein n=1 Tax=Engystomops pustulosus TaxID=76066 RepID=A0AAV7BE70_ENGPU|nr:hypothetical protein GDO81_011463 [Engystomops pustulosus]
MTCSTQRRLRPCNNTHPGHRSPALRSHTPLPGCVTSRGRPHKPRGPRTPAGAVVRVDCYRHRWRLQRVLHLHHQNGKYRRCTTT